MFWETRELSSLEKILESESFTLEQLLQDPLFPDECRAGNQKLLAFVMKGTTLSSLVDVILAGKDDTEEIAKTSVTAANAIASEPSIAKAIFQNTDLITKLFSSLDPENHSSTLITRNICKVLTAFFFQMTPNHVTQLQSLNVCSLLVKNIGSNFVLDLVSKLWDDDSIREHEDLIEYLHAEKFIPLLLAHFSESQDPSVHSNVKLTVSAILESREVPSMRPLISDLLSKDSTLALFAVVGKVGGVHSGRCEALAILTDFMASGPNDGVYEGSVDLSPLLPFLDKPAGVMPPPREVCAMVSICRLQALRFLEAVAKTQNSLVCKAIATSNVLQRVVILFFQIKNATLLHVTCFEIIRLTLIGQLGPLCKQYLLSPNLGFLKGLATTTTRAEALHKKHVIEGESSVGAEGGSGIVVGGGGRDYRVGNLVVLCGLVKSLAEQGDAEVLAATQECAEWEPMCSGPFTTLQQFHSTTTPTPSSSASSHSPFRRDSVPNRPFASAKPNLASAIAAAKNMPEKDLKDLNAMPQNDAIPIIARKEGGRAKFFEDFDSPEQPKKKIPGKRDSSRVSKEDEDTVNIGAGSDDEEDFFAATKNHPDFN